MKKTLLMLSALALCAALVCGCGKTPDDGRTRGGGLPLGRGRVRSVAGRCAGHKL